MDAKTLMAVVKLLPPDITVLVQGPTGIGKSWIAAQLAEHFGQDLIDCRLSTYQEGDMIGLPNHAVMEKEDVTSFSLPSWYIKACRNPCFLLLDELNRALPGVMQSSFQLVLDRQLGADKHGNPVKLHPGTRIMACVNTGAEYDVSDFDPALLRRFWVASLDPSLSSWVEWADDYGISPLIIEFLEQHPDHFFVDPKDVPNGTVIPVPASWHRLNDTLVHASKVEGQASMLPEDIAGGMYPAGFLNICHGFVGIDAGNGLANFLKAYDRAFTAEDVLDDYTKKVKMLMDKMSAQEKGALVKKVSNHGKDNTWAKKQARNVGQFIRDLPGELKVEMWNGVTQSKNNANIGSISAAIGTHVVDHIQIARNGQKS